MLQLWIEKLAQVLWSGTATRPGWHTRLIWLGRLLYQIGSDFMKGDIALRAMSLVFTTLLAVVPLLAVSFSVLKGFGVKNKDLIESYLLPLLEPLGAQGVEVLGRVIEFVENIKVGVLGSLGLALLFYSAFSLIQKVEQAFNNIWRLKQSRTLLRRMSDYLSVLVIGPILVFSAIGLSASMMSNELVRTLLEIEPFGQLYRVFLRIVPYLLVIAAFTFFYIFIPNTRVKIRAALIGGIVSGIIWQTTSWIFATVIVASAKYSAIYSGFATLIILMLWVNLNWLILLLGADLVYHLQHWDDLQIPQHQRRLSIADKESLALQILCVVGQAHYAGRQGVMMDELLSKIRLPEILIAEVIDLLQEAGLLSESAEPAELYLPGRPFDSTSVKTALDRLRRIPVSVGYTLDEERIAVINSVIGEADQTLQSILGEISLKQLSLAEPRSKETANISV
ncbi:MAG: YihY/virulence factor BrkB family protein [Gammaproteobacteria bacterium]|nr:YihY/virulence factor BrkB family protein [Gammaproteobacteria bacterium]